jgi:hypothetical protein
LSLTELDLGRLLMRSGGRAAAASGDPAPGPAPAGLGKYATADLLKRGEGAQQGPSQAAPGPTKRGGGRQDWGDDVIDLTPFAFADADLTLSA